MRLGMGKRAPERDFCVLKAYLLPRHWVHRRRCGQFASRGPATQWNGNTASAWYRARRARWTRGRPGTAWGRCATECSAEQITRGSNQMLERRCTRKHTHTTHTHFTRAHSFISTCKHTHNCTKALIATRTSTQPCSRNYKRAHEHNHTDGKRTRAQNQFVLYAPRNKRNHIARALVPSPHTRARAHTLDSAHVLL